MIASFWLSWSSRWWRTAATFWFRVGCNDAESRCVEVCWIVPRLIWFSIWVGDVSMVTWKCRIGAFLHTLTPWFATKVRWLCFAVSGQSAGSRRCLFHRAIEVYTNSISRLSRIFISQRENERGCIANCSCSSCSTRAANTTFWLTKIHHVDREGEIGVVRRWITTQEFRNLFQSNQKIVISRVLWILVCVL